jgi:hypothetical protein
VVALAATLAVVLGVTAYALVLADAVSDPHRDVASPALVRAHDRITVGGVALPARLDRARRAGPSRYEVNVSLVTLDRRWSVGPTPPRSADHATRHVGVQTAPGVVRSATLSVEVWT